MRSSGSGCGECREFGAAGRGAREEIPEEPGGRDPDIEGGVQAGGRDDLDFNGDVDEREKSERCLRQVARDGEEDCGQSERLIEDPAEGRDDERDEQERAAVLEPVPGVATRPEINQSPDAAENGGDEGDPFSRGVDSIAEEIAEAGSELARDN